jgi:metal-responsive CopG/Arc/MetJ family transcriptional regulator
MKRKTSITLSEEAIRGIDRLSGKSKNRSAIVELAVRAYILESSKHAREARDREIYERNAEELSRESLDSLSYQVGL